MTMLIVDSHYDEETLIRVAEAAVEIEDPHLNACDDCRIAVDEYRDMLSCMSDEVIWDQRPIDDTPNPQTIATLRAFVEDMHREDAEAEPLVAELLAGSREEWMPRLMADEKYRTAGVVRKLIAAMETAIRRMPDDAVAIAPLATYIADELPHSETGEQLRGSAWRESAFVHLYVGNYKTAVDASREAATAFTGCVAASYDEARLAVLDAQIARAFDDVDSGLHFISRAESVFAGVDDPSRLVSTTTVKAALLGRAGRYHEAIALMTGVLASRGDILSTEQSATLHVNLGYAYREVAEFADALRHLEIAAFMLDEMQRRADGARTRWNVAVVLLRAGRLREAAERLTSVVHEFMELGMHGPGALAALDLAETCLLDGDFDAVEVHCRRAIEQFTNTGLTYSDRARTALALLCEASEKRKASVALVRRISRYISELPTNPRLEFAFLEPPLE
jgi:tetratricopeptide (TPR) repeat protein